MSNANARTKFSCPACGGEAEWNPAKQALVCPYCGTTSPAQMEADDGGEQRIVEHDLVRALREIPDEQRGWQAERVSVRCQSCQAISVFSPEKVSQACDFCGSTALIAQEDQKQPFRPESLVPMQVNETTVRESVRTWYGSHFWAPSGLGKKAMTDRVGGLYIPYWTFDAHAEVDWTADSGTYYYETRTVNGKTTRVRRVRWTPVCGHLQGNFDDLLVAASKGVHEKLLRKLEPFDTGALVPYAAHYLSGWVVERYQIDLVEAAQRSRERMEEDLRRRCEKAVPGDTQRNLVMDADFSRQTFKHILLPVWLLTYQFRGKSYQVLVNGQTGEIAGETPLSWPKVLSAVALAVAVAGTLYYFFGR